MKRPLEILNKIEEIILVLSLTIMLLITFGNVLSRKILLLSWAFAEEVTVILFIFSSLIGAAVAAKRGSLIGLTVLYDLVPSKSRRVFFIVNLIASLFFSYIVVFYGVKMVQSEMLSKMTTPVLGVPEWIFGLSIPFGGLILGIRLVEYHIRELISKGEE